MNTPVGESKSEAMTTRDREREFENRAVVCAMSVDVCGLWMERAYVRAVSAGGGTRLSGLHSLRGRVPEAERAPPPHMRNATKHLKKDRDAHGQAFGRRHRGSDIGGFRPIFCSPTRVLSLDLFRVLDAHFQRFPSRATRGRGPVRRYSRNL